MSTYRVLTTVTPTRKSKPMPPVDLDEADFRRDFTSACDLRNSYVMALVATAGERGARLAPVGRYGVRVAFPHGMSELVDIVPS